MLFVVGMRLGCWLSGLSIRCRSLMRCADVIGNKRADVDIFDAGSRQWTTAALSITRDRFAATSLPNHGLAIFAGGDGLWFAFCFWRLMLRRAVCCGRGSGRDAFGLLVEWFEHPLLITDALRRRQ